MPIYTVCPTCNAGYDLADVLRGKRVICQNCKDAFLVQETIQAPAATIPFAAPTAPYPPESPTPPLPLGSVPEARPQPPPLPFGQPGYDVNPPGQPTGYQDQIPVATVAVPEAGQPVPEAQWAQLPRRRSRRRQASSGLSTGAIVALVVGPIVLLLAVGLLLWWVLSTPRRSAAWAEDNNPGGFQPNPGPRPAIVPAPIFVPGPRFNNPPPRFNPPVRANPPVRVRFR
jgi:hypothetical protein